MTGKVKLISAEEVRAKDLQNPEYRAEWERTALARAVAIAVLGYRLDHHLSQTKLAKLLGVRQPHVSRLELGEHNPSLEMLQPLSRVLGLRFIVEIAPAGQGDPESRLVLPAGGEIVQQVITADGSRVLIAAG